MTPPPVTIRSFAEADRAAVRALWNRVFPDDPPWNAPDVMMDTKSKVQPELFFVAQAPVALATAEAPEIVGTVLAGFDGVRGWIYHLAVAPELRRRGLATQLVRAAEAAVQRLGCAKINLQVRASNQEVIAFYRRLGYQVEDRVSMGRRL